MTDSDYISLIVGGGSLVVIIVGWLLKHSARLTSTEVRVENLASNARDDRERADRQNNNIMGALIRIEEKVDRKMDRHGAN
ncbi:MAG TPA: hypothetical protein VN731_10155 [Rhodanobacter sp.]|nr:hypothetical protein [Rhodanobacter sp.]